MNKETTYPMEAVVLSKEKDLPEYEAPTMITYSEKELLEELGPIQACSGFSASVMC